MLKLLALATIVVLSLAVTEKNQQQGNFFSEEFSKAFGDSYLGKVILSMAELKDHLKGFDFGTLFVALDELQEMVQERADEENTLLAQDKDLYLSDSSYYSNQITQYSNEAAQHKSDLSQLHDERASLEATLVNKAEELVESNKLKDALARTIESNELTFKTQNKDYQNAIQVIDQALEILEQIKEDDSVSLIQTKQDSLTQLSQQLDEKLSVLKSDRRIFFKPLISSLVAIASSRFADQQLLQKVLTLLNELRNSLNSNRLTLIDNYQNEKKNNLEIYDEYSEKIDALEHEVIPQLQETLLQVHGEMSSKNALLDDANGNLEDAEQNNASLEKRWLERQTVNRQLSEQYNNELAIIAQSLTALERGGIRRQ